MKVYGIDPAPRKSMSVFDGAHREIALEESADFLDRLAGGDDCLVCWDAPLTGPPSAVVESARAASGGAFSQRPIESFFDRTKTGYKTPAGISVQGYSGCSHWAITRALLGLPRVGRFDDEAAVLPFSPLLSDAQRPSRGRCVVEVHPAVAMWLWCRENWSPPTTPWFYKKRQVGAADRPAVLAWFWSALLEVAAFRTVSDSPEWAADPTSDDELDSRVAYALGRLWLDGSSEVFFLGDADTGGFLLPRDPSMEEAFKSFRVETSASVNRQPLRAA